MPTLRLGHVLRFVLICGMLSQKPMMLHRRLLLLLFALVLGLGATRPLFGQSSSFKILLAVDKPASDPCLSEALGQFLETLVPTEFDGKPIEFAYEFVPANRLSPADRTALDSAFAFADLIVFAQTTNTTSNCITRRTQLHLEVNPKITQGIESPMPLPGTYKQAGVRIQQIKIGDFEIGNVEARVWLQEMAGLKIRHWDKYVSATESLIASQRAGILMSLAKDYSDRDFHRLAALVISLAIEIDPANKNLYLFRVAEYEVGGYYALAQQDITWLINHDISNHTYWAWRASSFLDAEDYHRAEKDFSMAVKLDPENPEYLFSLAHVKYLIGDSTAAFQALDQAIALDTGQVTSVLKMKLVWLVEAKKYQQALEVVNRLLAESPDDPRVLMARADIHYFLGNTDQSGEDLRKSQAILGQMHLKLMKVLAGEIHPEYLVFANHVIEAASQNSDGWMARAMIYAAMGKKDLAIADMRQAISLNPTSYLEFARAAQVMQHLEEYQGVRQMLEEAVRLNPHVWDLHEHLANYHLAFNGGIPAAIAYLSEVLLIEEFSGALCNRGELYLYQGQMDLARRDFERALQLYPKDLEVQGKVGDYYRQVGSLAKAENQYAKVIQQSVGMNEFLAQALNNRGYIYLTTERFEACIADFDRLIEEADENQLGFAYSNRGRCHLELGNLEAAESDLEIAISSQPDNPFAWTNWAKLKLQLADETAAREALQKALALDDEHEEARTILAMLNE